jgi:hypothetical protein
MGGERKRQRVKLEGREGKISIAKLNKKNAEIAIGNKSTMQFTIEEMN